MAPMNSSRRDAVRVPIAERFAGHCDCREMTVDEVEGAECPEDQKHAQQKPKSPMRLTIKAFLPASAADFFVK